MDRAGSSRPQSSPCSSRPRAFLLSTDSLRSHHAGRHPRPLAGIPAGSRATEAHGYDDANAVTTYTITNPSSTLKCGEGISQAINGNSSGSNTLETATSCVSAAASIAKDQRRSHAA